MKVLMVCRKRVKNDWLSVMSDITFLIKVWGYILQKKIFFTRNINDYKKERILTPLKIYHLYVDFLKFLIN